MPLSSSWPGMKPPPIAFISLASTLPCILLPNAAYKSPLTAYSRHVQSLNGSTSGTLIRYSQQWPAPSWPKNFGSSPQYQQSLNVSLIMPPLRLSSSTIGDTLSHPLHTSTSSPSPLTATQRPGPPVPHQIQRTRSIRTAIRTTTSKNSNPNAGFTTPRRYPTIRPKKTSTRKMHPTRQPALTAPTLSTAHPAAHTSLSAKATALVSADGSHRWKSWRPWR